MRTQRDSDLRTESVERTKLIHASGDGQRRTLVRVVDGRRRDRTEASREKLSAPFVAQRGVYSAYGEEY